MSVADIKKGVEQKMQRSIEAFKNDLAKIRTGRAHTGLLDHVQVDYYGSMVPISQVANLTLVDARTIGVQPWEKNMVAKVEKAIREADLGDLEQPVRERDPTVRRRTQGLAVLRYGSRRTGQRQSLLTGRDLQGEWHRPIPLSRLAVC